MPNDDQDSIGKQTDIPLEQVIKDKFQILTAGITLEHDVTAILGDATIDYGQRKGIAGGLDLILPGDIHVSAPIHPAYTTRSAYGITETATGLALTRNNQILYPVRHLPVPDFVGKKTTDGVELSRYGTLYTDRLGVSIVKGCKYAMLGHGCKFCEIGLKPRMCLNSLSGVKELIEYCEALPSINFRHVLLTGGCGLDEMWEDIVEFIKGVSSCTQRPIYYMTTPMSGEKIEVLHQSGIAEIGMNIELWDRDLALRYMPGKGKLRREDYLEALSKAVSIWGCSGEVRSILIVGLEPVENTLEAVYELAEMKVMPILSPFRALRNTPMAGMKEPDAEVLFEVWKKSQQICERHNINLGPLCKACQNNTITAPVTTDYLYY
jgi:hypothetical protein